MGEDSSQQREPHEWETDTLLGSRPMKAPSQASMRNSLLAPRGFVDGTKASSRPARAVMEATRLGQADPGSEPYTVQLRLRPNLCISVGETGTEPLIAGP